jgi:adenine/guanine phosphoribosyltransferase-like PRPP-binding protein
MNHWYLLGIEARGFIFGPAIALAIGAKFIPLRKPKKLPGDVFEEENTDLKNDIRSSTIANSILNGHIKM